MTFPTLTTAPEGQTASEATQALSTVSRARSVVSGSLRPYGLQPARLLCPWDPLGKNTGVGCHCRPLPGGSSGARDQMCISCVSCVGRRVCNH